MSQEQVQVEVLGSLAKYKVETSSPPGVLLEPPLELLSQAGRVAIAEPELP
jgi:hypothetical protein